MSQSASEDISLVLPSQDSTQSQLTSQNTLGKKDGVKRKYNKRPKKASGTTSLLANPMSGLSSMSMTAAAAAPPAPPALAAPSALAAVPTMNLPSTSAAAVNKFKTTGKSQ